MGSDRGEQVRAARRIQSLEREVERWRRLENDALKSLDEEVVRRREVERRATRLEEALRGLVKAVGWIDYFAADDGNDLSAIVLERLERAKAELDTRRREGER